MKREGKVIEGFPNYLIYPDGSVFSKKRNKFLKQCLNNKGYMMVNLYNNRKVKLCTVHRLVGLAYIPNPENKPCIDHINRIKTDNRLENLQWATLSENQINTGIRKDNKLGLKNIYKTKYGYSVEFVRNKNYYTKHYKTLDKAIIQRDLMLSMWP